MIALHHIQTESRIDLSPEAMCLIFAVTGDHASAYERQDEAIDKLRDAMMAVLRRCRTGDYRPAARTPVGSCNYILEVPISQSFCRDMSERTMMTLAGEPAIQSYVNALKERYGAR